MSIAIDPRRTGDAPAVAPDAARLDGRAPVDVPSPVPALLLEHVSKAFIVGRRKKRVVAVDDVSLRLERGEIYGVLGANGSGKSTLIRLISTLLTIDSGRVEVFGHDVERDEMAVKRLINRVSVDAAFFKKLSPAENLVYAARLYGIDAEAGAQRGDPDPGPARHRRVAPRPAAGADEPGDAAEGRHRASPADEPDPAAPRRADDRPRSAIEAGRPDLHRGAPRQPRRHHRADDARPGRGRAPLRHGS